MAARASLVPSELSSRIAAAVQTAREVDLSDPLETIRADLSGGIDLGRVLVGDAAETLAETAARLQGRSRRRSRRRPVMVGLAIGTTIGLLAFAAWWFRRRAHAVAVSDDPFDRASRDRAADEGMGTTIGSPEAGPSGPERVPVAIEIMATDASGA